MKCILLCAPGEILEGESEWSALGYDVRCYPTTQDVSSLRDERDEEFTPFLGFRPEACDRPYVRSLRASFIRMLRDPAFADDDFVLFGESDATPVIEARTLESTLRELFHQQPEIDVARLFNELTYSPENLQGTKLLLEPYLTGPRTRSTPSVWGTHALVIPARSRQKIANLFAACRLPTDTCLEAAGSRGEIVMMVARDNWFYQKPRTHTFDQTTLYSYRQRKIAACLSSCKRLHDTQRQILAFMQQNYPNFHLFVAVKGITEYVFRQILVPPCQRFIDEGRLTLRLFPNKNPLANLIDTVRDLDVADYELFAKIDDNAFYNPEYLTLVNDFHTAAPQHHGSYYNDVGPALGRRNGYVFLKQEPLARCGSSFVLTRKQWQLACLRERETDCVPSLLSANPAGIDWCLQVDGLLRAILQQEGCSNRGEWGNMNAAPCPTLEKASASVICETCGGLIGEENKRPWQTLPASGTEEFLLELDHPDWHDTLIMKGNRGSRLENDHAHAQILVFHAQSVTVRWHDSVIETFVKTDDGMYRLEETV